MKKLKNYSFKVLEIETQRLVHGGSSPRLNGSLYAILNMIHATSDFVEGALDSFNLFRKKK